MKKMKRFVAILLASVMALVMLTACGESGSGSKSFAQQVEEAYMQNVNASLDENSKLQNDTAIRNRAMAMLDKIDENGMIAAKDAVVFSYGVENGEQVVTMILAAQPNSHETNGKVPAIEVTAADLEKLKNNNDPMGRPSGAGEYKAVGIAAKTMSNGKTYVAAGITYAEEVK